MKRKLFNALLFGALVVSSTSTFVSCKDYDDDIQNLQAQIDANSKAIKDLEALIKAGSVITSVDPVTNGVKVTLSDGKSFEITNGKDGKDGKNGTVVTMGDNGNWFIDGADSGKPWKGVQGEPGNDGPKGENGYAKGTYYLLNADCTAFDKYVDGVKQSESISIEAFVNQLTSTTVKAVMTNDGITFTNVTGVGTTYTISFKGDLRSLVFKPLVYIDGIETIEYKWIEIYRHMAEDEDLTGTNWQGKQVQKLVDYDYLPAASDATCYYGPAWPVDYHLNPANADVEYSDIVGFNALNPKVIETRAIGDKPIIKSPEFDIAGQKVFNVADGILTAGLQITNPKDLVPYATQNGAAPTTNYGMNDKAWTVALQSITNDAMETSQVVTSDYAALRPTKYNIVSLVWAKKPQYLNDGDDARVGDGKYVSPTSLGGTVTRTLNTTDNSVYWDSRDAVADNSQATAAKKGAALEMDFEDPAGINIADYLGISFEGENLNPNIATKVSGIWEFGNTVQKAMGFKYEFRLVDYKVANNETRDSRYGKWVNPKTDADGNVYSEDGVLRAWNVKYDGAQADGTSQSAVDREPLVQVIVKDWEGKVVLDGYILVHIGRNITTPEKSTTVEWPAEPVKSFDLCNALDVFESTWSEFHDLVLVNKMDNMTKNDFDAQYEIDVNTTLGASGVVGTTTSGDTKYALNIFTKDPTTGAFTKEANPLGMVTYIGETTGTTNHVFIWTLAADELEELTHHQNNLPINVERYVRYKKKAVVGNPAEYDYIYVKLNGNIDRILSASKPFEKKIAEYWFSSTDGSDAGTDAIILDVKEPTKGGNITAFNRGVRATLEGNMETITGERKYYFLPIDQVVKGEDGVEYTITAWDGQVANKEWKEVYCKYLATAHEYDAATINTLLNECAVRYGMDYNTTGSTNTTANGGAFENNKLYVKTASSTYQQIATLDQATGEIYLLRNNYTKAVLNAIGYKANHANVPEEMRTWVGVIASNDCNVATPVSDFKFLASWQRPINLLPIEKKEKEDATTNGVKVNVFDILKLYDWRGCVDAGAATDAGKMWDENTWFWAYYGINKITVDVRKDQVTTNLNLTGAAHDDVSQWRALGSVTSLIDLYWSNGARKDKDDKHDFALDLTNNNHFNDPAQNANIITYLSDIANTGQILYYNNGENVEEFSLRIPITISYTWGNITDYFILTVKRTVGH